MRAWLKTGAIPNDVDLRAQLIGPTYTFNLRNEIQLERKEDMMKRGVESPDFADALALTFSYPVAAHAGAGGEGPAKPLIETEYNPFDLDRMIA
jgi:phage terminase large subunit